LKTTKRSEPAFRRTGLHGGGGGGVVVVVIVVALIATMVVTMTAAAVAAVVFVVIMLMMATMTAMARGFSLCVRDRYRMDETQGSGDPGIKPGE
jgi:hypothetical protein